MTYQAIKFSPMLYHSFKLVSDADVSTMLGQLMRSSEWIDGAHSALAGAKLIKRNIQLSPKSDTYLELECRVVDLLMSEMSVLDVFICPKKIHNLLFSRTSVGMYYGQHVDSVHLPEGRRDYSFTIFLNDPSEYDGGELILEMPPEKKVIKLSAGSIIIYPTKYLHEVREVTSGERVVCVGWIESYIKRDDEREMLACVRAAMARIHKNFNGESIAELDIAYQRLRKYFGG